MAMKTVEEYLGSVGAPARSRLEEILAWVADNYPQLELRIAWNQPMFTRHGTYIIGFSAATKHTSIAPEHATMIHFEQRLREGKVDHSKMLVRQPLDAPFDYDLLAALIDHQLEEKASCKTFWRAK